MDENQTPVAPEDLFPYLDLAFPQQIWVLRRVIERERRFGDAKRVRDGFIERAERYIAAKSASTFTNETDYSMLEVVKTRFAQEELHELAKWISEAQRAELERK